MMPIAGFAPDADFTTRGVVLDCQHFIPYSSGYRGAPSAVNTSAPALATACTGAAIARLLDGTTRIFAGTATKIWELVGGVWTDRSSAVYTGAADTRWSFCVFGNTVIATNLADAMQSSASGAFANVGGGAPKARIVVSASNNFVIAFNTSDGTFGVSQDRWWCCAQGDQTNWTPSVSTLATTGRLTSVEGEIVAALPLGDQVMAYKRRAIFVGSFAGSPVVWQWSVVPSSETGAVGQEAVCDIGGAHFIVGEDNFWIFDGTRPLEVGDGVVRKWFLNDLDPSFDYRTRCIFDKQNNIVRISYARKGGAGAVNGAIVYHTVRKQWGRDDVTSQANLNYVVPGVTINGLDSISSTINGLSDIPFDSAFWASNARILTYFNSSNQLVSLTGSTANSYFVTGDMGEDEAVTMLDTFRVRYEVAPSSATATGFYKMNEGESLTQGPTASLADGKFDIRQSGRWHRILVNMTGDNRVYGYLGKPVLLGGR